MILFSAIIADGTFPCSTAILQGPCHEVFRRARERGYDAVQLTIRDTDDYSAVELQELMREYRLVVSAMATGRVYTADGLSMGSSDEVNRRACVDRLCRLAKFGASLRWPDWTPSPSGFRCPALVIGAVRGLFRDASSPEEYYRQFNRSLREVAIFCESLGVPVILEADDHLEADAYCDPEETLDYVREIGSPSLRMYLDTMHLYNEDMDPAAVIRKFGAAAFSIDISGENRKAVTESAMDFRDIAEAILSSGFSGFLTFEMPETPPADNAAVSLGKMKECLGMKVFSRDARS